MFEHTQVKMSKIPDCDICAQIGKKAPAKYDGATTMGPWAYMCRTHFVKYGFGLGLGKGQELILEK